MGCLKEVASAKGWEGPGSLHITWRQSLDLMLLLTAAPAKRQALFWCVTHTDSCNSHCNLWDRYCDCSHFTYEETNEQRG